MTETEKQTLTDAQEILGKLGYQEGKRALENILRSYEEAEE